MHCTIRPVPELAQGKAQGMRIRKHSSGLHSKQLFAPKLVLLSIEMRI